MQNSSLSQRNRKSARHLSQRIAYCRQVMQITLCLGGTILAGIQIAKFISSTTDERKYLSWSIGLVVGALLVAIALSPLLEGFITRLALKIRNRGFAIAIYSSPLLLTLLLLIVKICLGQDSLVWENLSSERGVSEYGTAIFYLLVSVFAYPMVRPFWREGRKLMAVCYGLLTLAGFFVGMEEISWGQRLIGFEEPQFWAEHNAQSEFTFHNLSFYHEHLLNESFIVVGLIGSFSWLALRWWQPRKLMRQIDLSYIVPDWFISSFFYPTLIFYIIHVFTDGLGFFITRDQEHCEFIMSLGILLFVVINFLRQANDRDRLNLSD